MTFFDFLSVHPFGVAFGIGLGIVCAAIGWAWIAGSER